MLIVLSPAKTLDLETPSTTKLHTTPDFLHSSGQLIDVLRRYSPGEVGSLMHISDALAHLNAGRYASWGQVAGEARQAVMAFNGDVYAGLDVRSLKPASSVLAGIPRTRFRPPAFQIAGPANLA